MTTLPLDDRSFRPPAPMVRGGVGPPLGLPVARCAFLVDTGSDRTLLPEAVAFKLGFNGKTAPRVTMRTFGGTPIPLPTCGATVDVEGYAVDLTCVVQAAPYGLLGRDFLRHVRIMLDGPAGTLTIDG